jgi:hypothetical protein
MASDGLDVFNFKSISSLQLLINVVTEHTQCNASQVWGYCDHDICANSSVLQCRCFLCAEYASHRKVEAAVEVFIYDSLYLDAPQSLSGRTPPHIQPQMLRHRLPERDEG